MIVSAILSVFMCKMYKIKRRPCSILTADFFLFFFVLVLFQSHVSAAHSFMPLFLICLKSFVLPFLFFFFDKNKLEKNKPSTVLRWEKWNTKRNDQKNKSFNSHKMYRFAAVAANFSQRKIKKRIFSHTFGSLKPPFDMCVCLAGLPGPVRPLQPFAGRGSALSCIQFRFHSTSYVTVRCYANFIGLRYRILSRLSFDCDTSFILAQTLNL